MATFLPNIHDEMDVARTYELADGRRRAPRAARCSTSGPRAAASQRAGAA